METIRKADMNDSESLVHIIKTAFTDVLNRLKISAEDAPKHPSNITEKWIEDAFEKGVDYYLFEEDGEPIACYALEKAKKNVCYLERLAVLPDRQQKGIGGKMVFSAVENALSMGAHFIEIGIIANDYPLFRFYKQCGFIYKKTKTFQHLPFTVGFMELQLG